MVIIVFSSQVVMASFTYNCLYILLFLVLDLHHYIFAKDVLRGNLGDSLFAEWALIRDFFQPLAYACFAVLVVTAVQLAL